MQARAETARREGRRIAFVPTMGYLHEGHMSLLREGRRRGELLVLSIFVNPLQFGPSEDLARYPRDLDGDLAKARGVPTDVAYVPDAAAMYPEGFQTVVEVREVQRGLCGERRPGHFAGVATVVLKLFCQVRPHVAIFGEKDWQQLQVIRRMARDLDLGIEILSAPIVREADGLALSSRNAYLGADERRRAAALSRGLDAARARFAAGEREAARLVEAARAPIDEAASAHPTGCAASAHPTGCAGLRLEYLELRDAETLAPLARADRPAVLAVAAFVGATRLIDNVVLA